MNLLVVLMQDAHDLCLRMKKLNPDEAKALPTTVFHW